MQAWLRSRPKKMLPNVAAVTGALVLAGHPLKYTLAVAGTLTFVLALAWYEGRRACARRASARERSDALYVGILMIAAHAVVVELTGGLFSPIMPSFLAACVAGFHILGRRLAAGMMLLAAVVFIVAIALCPSLGPSIKKPYDVALMVWSLVHAMVILRGVALFQSEMQRTTTSALDRAREDLLATTALRAKSLEALSSRVAHELKNPLASIKALVKLVRRDPGAATTQERLEVVESEVTRMEQILRDYLSFSRPLEEIKPQPVELGVLADDVIATLEGRASAAGVSIARDPSTFTIVGDPRRLKEALLNLIGNAVEATPPGGAVDVAVREHDGGARIVIKDSGRGMAESELRKIGTPFFTTKGVGGTGLGVVLARSVVTQHGGTLEYASEYGKGTVATVTLPFRPSTSSSAS